MKPQTPAWLVAPAILLVALGAILLVGKSAQMADTKPAALASQGPVTFPDFSGSTVDGSTFRLSDSKGKVVLINFWATWCGPCRMEIPDLIELQKKYGPRGFVVVGLSEDVNFETASAFAKANGMTYPILKTPDEVHQSLAVDGLPTSVLLNRQGVIVKVISGVSEQVRPEDMWAPDIEKVL